MSWIKTIKYDDADAKLKRIYDRVKGPNDNVDNVLSIHSLRPHTLIGHMTLYKSVIHNSNNTLPKWYLESLGIYVSYLNNCSYCVQHHFEGLKSLLEDNSRCDRFMSAVVTNNLESEFDTKFFRGFEYARRLTTEFTSINEADVNQLKEAGFTDGEILEVNQLASYFNYVNRMVVGLGVDTKGDILGLSPGDSEDVNNWNHN